MNTPGFSFPPPPPPPPLRATQAESNFNYPSSGRGFGNSRDGHRGRGRGRGGSYRGQRGNDYGGAGSGYGRHRNSGPRLPNAFSQPQNGTTTQPHVYLRGPQSSKPFYGQEGCGNHGTGVAQSTSAAPTYHSGFGGQPSWMGSSQDAVSSAARHAAKAANAFLGPDAQAQRNSGAPNGKAPPAVPNFGFSLPVAQGPVQSKAIPSPKKKRKHNQLGLTPQMEAHESSEDDVDEESRLGATVNAGGLSFMHRGKLCALKSREDIASWIAERRKCYPTKARVAEKAQREIADWKSKPSKEPAKPKFRKPNGATKDTLESQDLIHVRNLVDGNEASPQVQPEQSQTVATLGAQIPDKATKAKMKAEKLREKFERAQRRAEKLESKSKPISDSLPRNVQDRMSKSPIQQKSKSDRASGRADLSRDEISTKMQYDQRSLQPDPGSASLKVKPLKRHHQRPDVVSSDESSSSSDSENSEFTQASNVDEAEETSSSDSSSSSTTSDESDITGDAASDASSSAPPSPLRIPSSAPERVPPPACTAQPQPRTKRQPCHALQRRGHCPRGDSCHFSHDPARLNRERPMAPSGRGKMGGKAKRQEAEPKPLMTLYQRLLARQMEEDAEAEAAQKANAEGTG